MRFTISTADAKTIKSLANEYLVDKYVSFKALAAKYRTTPSTISKLIWRGIAEDIIDARLAKSIYYKIVNKPNIGWYQRKMRWDEAFDRREELIQERQKISQEQEEALRESELETLKGQQQYYKDAINNYDEYFIDDEASMTIEELQEKLDDVTKKIDELT